MDFLTVLVSYNRAFRGSSVGPKNETVLRTQKSVTISPTKARGKKNHTLYKQPTIVVPVEVAVGGLKPLAARSSLLGGCESEMADMATMPNDTWVHMLK